MMNKFNEYKLVHNFMYPNDPIKKWITKDNYTDLFKEDWNELMPVVEKINSLEYSYNAPIQDSIYKAVMTVNIVATYKAVVEFIKWFNSKESNV